MNIVTVFVVMIVVMSVVVASGCTAPAPQDQAAITNQNEAQQVAGDVSQDASDLSDALTDLDSQLG